MSLTRRNAWIALFAGWGLALVSGCQTHNAESGLTLPSPHYLSHPPQYIPPSEEFPLPRETRSLDLATKKYYDDLKSAGP